MFSREANYKYSCARLIIMKLESEIGDGMKVTYINGDCGCMIRDTHCEADLEPGRYGIYAEVDWEDTCYDEYKYCITRYGPGLDGIEDCSD